MNLIEYRPARRPAPDARSETARASMTGLREPAAEALAVDDVRPPDAIAASVIDGVLATGVTAGSDWLESASRAQDDALDPARAALRDPAPAAVDRRP
ncbi:MAG: hypothetical protein R3F35_13230 [Myxococcota bacterium]